LQALALWLNRARSAAALAGTNGNADTATQTRKTPNSMRGNDIGRKYRISNRQCEWLTEFPPDDDDWSRRSGVKDRIHS